MKDEEFNKYCAEVMGWHLKEVPVIFGGKTYYWKNFDDKMMYQDYRYKPATDLNQMAGVFDKLNGSGFDKQARDFQLDVFVKGMSITQAMREFIESTKS